MKSIKFLTPILTGAIALSSISFATTCSNGEHEEPAINEYTIKFVDCVGITVPADKEVEENTKYEIIINASSGYTLPQTITVKVNNQQPKDGYYVYKVESETTAKLTIDKVTGDTTINIVATKEPEIFTDETPLEYIDHRTFSICGASMAGACTGTCWLISDSTPTIYNDYKYYVATNWHVTHMMDRLKQKSGGMIYLYADKSLAGASDIIAYESFIQFASFNQVSEDNFIYDDVPTGNWFNPAIDIFVAEVNFGQPTGVIEEKLNFVNNLQKTKGRINTFVQSDNDRVINSKKYYGGYPASPIASPTGTKWDFHELNKSFQYLDKMGFVIQDEYGDYEYGHAIGTPDKNQSGKEISYGPQQESEEWYNYDVSPQLFVPEGVDPTWMTAGASGSMLLTEDLEICGIYWGYAEPEENITLPFFSMFNTSEKNFLAEWM